MTSPLARFFGAPAPRPNPRPNHAARAEALFALAARAEANWMRPARARLAEARAAVEGLLPEDGPAAWERLAVRGVIPAEWADGTAPRSFVVVLGTSRTFDIVERRSPGDVGAAVAVAADVPNILAVEEMVRSVNDVARRWEVAEDPRRELLPPARVLWSPQRREPAFERIESGSWQYPSRDALSRRWAAEGLSSDTLLPPAVLARLRSEGRPPPGYSSNHVFLRMAQDAVLFDRYTRVARRGDPFRALQGLPNPLELLLEIAALGYCPIGPIFNRLDFGVQLMVDGSVAPRADGAGGRP